MSIKFSIYSVIIIIVYLNPSVVLSQDYIWPTNASEFMSSSFCEFREGHYHAAIDIKTWNTEGYPCYAIEDGYIKRIRVSPFGYGKVIYLQLYDGNTVIYAHLQKFTKEVEKQVRRQQFKNKRYHLDWWPKNLRVKKGEIIAYTGKTGIGVPHLHFEIRNEKDNPVNPLRYYTQIKDHRRPLLQDILVIPLTETSTINESYLPQKFKLSRLKDGLYVIKDPIIVKGIVGLAVKGYDQADKFYNKYVFYQSTLESANKLIFQITYNELDYATTEHIYTEIYYPHWSSENQVFNKLYLEPFNPLNFYDRTLGSDGTITITDKPVSFKVTISDYMKNQSIVKGELVPTNDQSLEILNSNIEDSLLYLKFTAPQIRELKFYKKNKKHPWSAVNYFEITEGRLSNPKEGIGVRLNLNDSTITSLKVEVNNTYEQTISLSPSYLESDLYENLIPLGNRIIGKFNGKFNNPRIQIKNTQTSVPFRLSGENNLQVVLSSKVIADQKAVFMMDDIFGNTKSLMLDYHSLRPGEKRSFFWFDSSLVLETGIKSVTDTTLITAVKVHPDSATIDIPTASEIYKITPNNFPIFQSIAIRIQADSLPQWGRWSIFKTNGKCKYEYLSAQVDTSSLYFSSRTSSFGNFVVAADTVAPEILIESPQSGKLYKSTPLIKIFLKDSVSGIEGEEQISLSMDGHYVLPEWDPEEDMIIGILENNLPSGNHTFSVTINDRAGNTTREAIYFTIQ